MADVKHRERGMVTAELAMIAPFGLAFTLLLVWIVALGITQVRIVDASAEAARMVARGDPVSAATALVERNAPHGARLTVGTEQGIVTITVTARSEPPIPFFHGIASKTLTARAVAVQEEP